MTSRVLVTGGTGFVGRPCVRRLAAAGADVRVLSRTNGVDLFDFDRTMAAVADVKPTHLLHLAWVTTPGEYWTSPDNPRWVEASLNLLRTFAAAGGRRVVITGTCAEYDWTAGVCNEFDTPTNPATLYGRCKNELRERAADIPGLSLAWARLFHLYGPGEHPARLVPSVARSLAAGEPADCTAGTQVRDFLHVEDAADALVTLLFSGMTGPVNVASGEPVAVRTVVEHIAAAAGRPDLLRLGARPTPPGEPPVLVADVSRLREELGWRPRISLSDGLKARSPLPPALRGEREPESQSPQLDRCPVCAAPNPISFLHRPGVPAHQNLLFPTPAAARAAARGTLDLRVCGRCGFVTNAAFAPDLLDYGPTYENSQDCSPAFAAYLGELADRIVNHHHVRTGRVVEVGCGKGAFLAKLLSHPENRCDAVGFDPSYVGPDAALGGRLRFVKAFYGPATAAPADAVVCRHVIEHVADPLALFRAIRAGIGAGRAKVFVETPCVEWVFRRRVPWDLFYEHCSLFTAHSLGLALTRAGFAVTGVTHVFGGQYLWAEAETGDGDWPDEPAETPALAAAFAADERQRIARWAEMLAELPGPVCVWGAGAKGATFCHLADPAARRVAAVVDVNPAKQGRFLAGTGHPIVAPEGATALGAASVIVLNPNYTAEVAAALARLGSPAAVIDLMAEENVPCG